MTSSLRISVDKVIDR